MKRKVFRLGTSTLVVSLPSKWAKKYNLGKGDELETIEKERSITFSTEKEYSQSEIEIDIRGLDKSLIRWYLTGAYVRGYDKIRILFEKQENSSVAQETINYLIGLAIVEQGNSYCIAGEISKTTSSQFDNVFRRIFLLIISVAEDSLTALKKNDKESLKGMERRDYDINKFINFCLRVLNKGTYKGYDKTLIIYDLLQELEELGDNYKNLALDLLGVDLKKIRKELKVIFEDINRLTRDFYGLFYDFKKEKVLDLHKKKNNILNRIDDLQNIKPYEITLLYHLKKIVENVQELFLLKIAAHF